MRCVGRVQRSFAEVAGAGKVFPSRSLCATESSVAALISVSAECCLSMSFFLAPLIEVAPACTSTSAAMAPGLPYTLSQDACKPPQNSVHALAVALLRSRCLVVHS